jgi:hypothetical protein
VLWHYRYGRYAQTLRNHLLRLATYSDYQASDEEASMSSLLLWFNHFGTSPIWNLGWWGDVWMHWGLEEAATLVVLAALFVMPCKHRKHQIMRVAFVVFTDLLLAITLKMLIG